MVLVAGFCLVLGMHAYLQIVAQTQLIEDNMHTTQRELGKSLAVAVAEVWRVDGESRALALVEQLNAEHARVRIRWVWLDPTTSTVFHPAAPLSAVADSLNHGDPAMWVDSRQPNPRMFNYLPVDVPDPRAGALELSESLVSLSRVKQRTVVAIILASLALVAMSGVMAWVLGIMMVGRPVRQLVELARRVGQGDFSGRIAVRGHDELSQLAAEMNTMIAGLDEATKARLEAMRQLRHADRLKTVGQLAAGVAHEIGTPLNIISMRAKMLASREVQGDAAVRNAASIGEQADRMARIIRHMLDFARPGRAEKEPCNVAELAEHTVELLQPMATKADIGLHLDLGAPPLEPRAAQANIDKDRLEQALTNLVVNAIQAMARGGHVTVGLRRESLTRPAEEGGGRGIYLTLSVRDTGPGIPPDVVSKLFDPFFTTKEAGVGTGLGLSVTRAIVEEHSGWISVETEVGMGTTFAIHLPPLAEH